MGSKSLGDQENRFVIHTIALNYPDNPSYDQKRIHEDFFIFIFNSLLPKLSEPYK